MSLPKWPTEKPEHLGLANSAYWETYERARAEAAIARLKVAVEALKLIGAGRGGICDETLAAIGEIPE